MLLLQILCFKSKLQTHNLHQSARARSAPVQPCQSTTHIYTPCSLVHHMVQHTPGEGATQAWVRRDTAEIYWGQACTPCMLKRGATQKGAPPSAPPLQALTQTRLHARAT